MSRGSSEGPLRLNIWIAELLTPKPRKFKLTQSSKTHPSRDLIWQKLSRNTPKIITSHDVSSLENKRFWHHGMLSCLADYAVRSCRRFFASGDGCWSLFGSNHIVGILVGSPREIQVKGGAPSSNAVCKGRRQLWQGLRPSRNPKLQEEERPK